MMLNSFCKVDVRLGKMLARVTEDSVFLNDGTKVPYGVLVWSGGVKAHPFISDLEFEHNRQDQIITDDYLRVLDAKDIFALGDCADIQNNSLPPTAMVASQQAKYLVTKNLVSVLFVIKT